MMRKAFLLPVLLAFGCQSAVAPPEAREGRSVPADLVDGVEMAPPVKCVGEECICTYAITKDEVGNFSLSEPQECKWPEPKPGDNAPS